MARHPLHRATVALAASLMLACCISTQTGRSGYNGVRDACRAQVLAMDSTSDFYGEQILQGAAGGALAGALMGGLASGRWEGARICAAID